MGIWESNDEFDEVFLKIRRSLIEDKFFETTEIENKEVFLGYLREYLLDAQDMDMLSDFLRLALDDYRKYEVDAALNNLTEMGLLEMVVRDDGELAYRATESGKIVNNMINTNDMEELKEFSKDIYDVSDVGGVVRFKDHGSNFELIVIPAGKQHDGDEMINFYHTIYQDYHDGGPNGEYRLVDSAELFNMLNTNYN
jgi:hypothetical protein